MNKDTASPDSIDRLLDLSPTSALAELRRRRDKVRIATEASYAGLFERIEPASRLPLGERLRAAQRVAEGSGLPRLAAHYGERLARSSGGKDAPGDPVLRAAIGEFADALTRRPREGGRRQLESLLAAGLATPDVVLLAQLIAFVTYQARLLAGAQALQPAIGRERHDTPPETAANAATEPFVHPANLPKPGEPVRVNGFTSETLAWRAWLPVVPLETATAEQLAVLERSHPTARQSDYYRLLAHQPAVLEERSAAFNAIMYAPGGLPRAERELASTAVSRLNGCVYCASVHAQRYEQLTHRNKAIFQLFDAPDGAGSTARERAIVRAALALTRDPGAFSTDVEAIDGLVAQGLSDLELLDLIHAVAIFAWANRLMLNLGEPVFKNAATAAGD